VLEVARQIPTHAPDKVTFPALARIRLAEPYEQLRDASDRALATTGQRPRIFLATLGAPADFTARATFAKNFFAAGGIEATGADAFATRADMLSAFRASGAKLACLCSSDKIYEAQASDAARALTEAGAPRIYLAGRGGRLEAALKQAGVAPFIYSGCDALSLLTEAHRALGLR
jgi:methylmalonyl-CoA mutase